MGTIKRLLILALFLFSISSVFAVQPQQAYNKIFLQPFYRASMSLNTNYTYNLSINPPDGLSSVLNAIVSFNGQINGQTQTFTLFVNGKSCNNPTYSVATAFSTTGNIQFSFDCSNVINKAGTYTLNFISAVNTGAMNGWIDLTYMNNPQGALSLLGTEYSPNDPATIFLQLQDTYGNAVQNGSCYVDIYYPLSGGTHPYIVQDAPMIQANGDDGLYYYDLTAPSTLGVYMLSAKCSYVYNWQWIYPVLENIWFPTRGANQGTWVGSSVALNDPSDSVYDSCGTSGSGTCQANYTFNISQYGKLNNITNINLYWLGESTASKVLTFAYYNGTAFSNLPNTVTLQATGSSTAPSGLDQLQTNTIPLNGILGANDTIIVRLTVVFTGTSTLYNNWLSLAVLTNYGTVQQLKGNSEMHVTNISGNTLAGLNCSPSAMWSYNPRTLTYFPTMNTTINLSGIPQQVWNYSGRNLTYYQNFTAPQVDMTNYTRIDSTIYAVNTTLYQKMVSETDQILVTSINLYNLTTTNIANIPSNVWNYTGNVALPLLNQIVSGVWNYTFGRYTNGEIV